MSFLIILSIIFKCLPGLTALKGVTVKCFRGLSYIAQVKLVSEKDNVQYNNKKSNQFHFLV